MKVLGLMSLLFALSSIGVAQTITSTEGSFQNQTQLTILGTGFGDKQNPLPVVWDNVETGHFDNGWSSTGNLRVHSTSRHQNSDFCGTMNFQGAGGDGDLGYFTSPGNVLGERWFVQYWFMIDENFDWGSDTYGGSNTNLANVKFFRMWNPGNVNENFHINLQGWGDVAQYNTEYVSDPRGGYAFHGFESGWTKGEWHCLQIEYAESTIGVNDGEFRVWFDGQLEVNDLDLMTREDYPDLKRPFIVGFYDAWNDSGTDRDDFYIDDVYVDRTWARVEIGDRPLYGDCTVREIQPVMTWGSNEIVIDVNSGSLWANTGLFVFVVTAEGSVSSGFSLEGDASPPGEPGQVTMDEE